MDTTALILTVTGLGQAMFVIWYFFFPAHEPIRAIASASGPQQVAITVKGGYSPAVLEVERGKPVQLRFFRDEESSCSEELLLPDFNIRRELLAHEATLVELLPEQVGTFEFTCGMQMLRGRIVVK